MAILDSGNRTEFESGAVRDIQAGKGRCDLLPMDIVFEVLTLWGDSQKCQNYEWEEPLQLLDEFQQAGMYDSLIGSACAFVAGGAFDGDIHTATLEYAIHLEEGADKYGDRNWQKGIPVRNYVNSGVRHYLKYLRGDIDERHDRAFVWNMLCGAWTAKHIPELNEYGEHK